VKNKLILSFLIISFTYIGLSFLSKPDSNCVNLYVDFGSLNAETKVEKCIDISAETNALELLKISGYTTEGTQKYGDAVVCRLNGLPDKSIETCEVMPPEDAYWAVIVKEKKLLPLFNEWGWAQTGINEISLSEGDSLGLVFSTNGDLQWP
jgi:hypothetical protein